MICIVLFSSGCADVSTMPLAVVRTVVGNTAEWRYYQPTSRISFADLGCQAVEFDMMMLPEGIQKACTGIGISFKGIQFTIFSTEVPQTRMPIQFCSALMPEWLEHVPCAIVVFLDLSGPQLHHGTLWYTMVQSLAIKQ